MKHLLLFASLVGCVAILGHEPHVPSDFQGTTQITVANAWDRELCVFTVFHDANTGENWLGDKSKKQNLAPGATRVFSIKPGTYHVVGGFCDNEQPVAASGTYGAATTTIEGPTLIAFGPNPVAPIAGDKTLGFTQLYTTGQSGGASEAEAPAAEEPAAETSSTSSSAPVAAEPAKGPVCLAHGAVCDNDHHCCAGNTCSSRFKYSDGSLGNGSCE